MDAEMKPGLRANEIAKCALCNQGVCQSNYIHFYQLTIEQHIVDPGAVRRHAGMEMMMGGGQAGAVMAGILGPNEPLTHALPSSTISVCGDCAMKSSIGSAIAASE